MLAQLSDSELLRTRLCGVNYLDVWVRQLFKIRVQLRLSVTRLSVSFYQPSCWRAAVCGRCWRKRAYVAYHVIVPL